MTRRTLTGSVLATSVVALALFAAGGAAPGEAAADDKDVVSYVQNFRGDFPELEGSDQEIAAHGLALQAAIRAGKPWSTLRAHAAARWGTARAAQVVSLAAGLLAPDTPIVQG